jgi:hypothetical protein
MSVYNCFFPYVGISEIGPSTFQSCVGAYTQTGAWNYSSPNYETFVDSTDGGTKLLMSSREFTVFELPVGCYNGYVNTMNITDFNNPSICWNSCYTPFLGQSQQSFGDYISFATNRSDSLNQYTETISVADGVWGGGNTCFVRPIGFCYSYCVDKGGSTFTLNENICARIQADILLWSCACATINACYSLCPNNTYNRYVCVPPLYMCRSQFNDNYTIITSWGQTNSLSGIGSGGGSALIRQNQCLYTNTNYFVCQSKNNINWDVMVVRNYYNGDQLNFNTRSYRLGSCATSFFVGPYPSTPSITQPTSGQTITPTNVIQWSSSTCACCYQLQISTDPTRMNTCEAGEFTSNCTYTGVSCTSAVFNSMFTVPDGTYYMRIRSINNDFHSCWSGCVCFTLQSGFPHVGLSNGILVQSSAAQNGNMVLCNGSMYYRTDSECSNRSITLTTATGILKVGCQ